MKSQTDAPSNFTRAHTNVRIIATVGGVAVALASVLALVTSDVWACGPFFPNDYYVIGGKDPLKMIDLSFFHELSRTLQREDPSFVSPDTDRGPLVSDAPWSPTLASDAEELELALTGSPDEIKSTVEKYQEMRQAIRSNAEKNWAEGRGSGARIGRLAPVAAPVQEKEQPIKPFDLAPYEELLKKIPAEFALYVRGAAAYYNEDTAKAIEYFNAVLALPEADRKNRSTWAAYMLGKANLAKDPKQAVTFFQRTRQLAEQGFSDSLELAKASEGWEARAHAIAGEFVPALNGYVAMATSEDDAESYMGYVSLQSVCEAVLERGAIDKSLTEDAKARSIMTAYVIANGDEDGNGAWLKAIESSVTGEGPVADADRLAWIAYEKGDMDAAARWLKRADAEAPYAKWIQAKLYMREGKLDLAASTLESLRNGLKEDAKWPVAGADGGYPEMLPARQEVTAEIGAVKFNQGDYKKAFLSLLEGDQWADAAYIGERVMTPEELGDAIAALDAAGSAISPDSAKSARHLYARRLARSGAWDKATPFFPDDEIKAAAKQTGDAMAHAKDDTLPLREHAQALFDAAELLREHGLDLIGTELEPDWYLNFGSFENDITRLKTPDAAVPVSKEEAARVAKTEVHPGKRYHYRYLAADLMWECAKLLPNNDTLTAKALYTGGTYLQNRDPEAADRFYKALVRRNPNLAIAREADDLRWFPEEFSDVVLYKARPPHMSRRKMAIGAAAGAGGVIVLVGLWWGLQRKRKRPAAA